MQPLNKVRSVLAGERERDDGPPDESPELLLRRLRIALTAFFALDGFIFAGWVVRIPAIKEQTGASAGALGLALLGVSVGGVVTMTLTGRLCRRFGSHRVIVVSGVLLSCSVVLPPLTASALALGLVLLVFGAAYGGISVAVNAAAVELVDVLRRPVMPGFHAAFSLGGMLGAGLGGLVAGQLSATRHLLLLAALGLALTAVAARPLLAHAIPAPAVPEGEAAAEHRESDPGGGEKDGRSMAGRARRLVLILGLIALCTEYGEGALADWSALHLSADLGAGAGTAAMGYSVFSLAMTVGRLSGTALLERFGQSRVLVTSGVVAAVGMLAGALGPSVPAVLTGFVISGLGLANIIPIAIARSGALAGPSGVAAASTMSYGGILLGPVAIGFLADWFSLTIALTTTAGLAALAAAVAFAVRHSALEDPPAPAAG
ncbi:MFS transporter [Streptomyces sp. CAU 1734]|uniref:MFS transporter n=1 Tax=Streptomyces sp. CAU 1734 TaxID=3140360 RepID=UPI003260542A